MEHDVTTPEQPPAEDRVREVVARDSGGNPEIVVVEEPDGQLRWDFPGSA